MQICLYLLVAKYVLRAFCEQNPSRCIVSTKSLIVCGKLYKGKQDCYL